MAALLKKTLAYSSLIWQHPVSGQVYRHLMLCSVEQSHAILPIRVGGRSRISHVRVFHLAEATLRHATLAVLGPRSINESKFSEWSSEIVALGLRWNTIPHAVSISEDKTGKAYDRVIAMPKCGASTKT
ncbi:hypothetical protein PHMEG_0008919 [Phytophthora megakarya]|uniref:Uncharacterized protein n=1 Tax=Phytophthora megakarya TaxID=4795 RepID=A0A225WIV0_9STRA|nr:hypothetical protein PHMEG_0008919 [Phytophthora megakarya]